MSRRRAITHNMGWVDPQTGDRLPIGVSGGIMAELTPDGKHATQDGFEAALQKQQAQQGPQIISRRPLTPQESAQSAALNTPASLAGKTPVDSALNTFDWRKAIDSPAASKSADTSVARINAAFEKEMGDSYEDFNYQLHGDQPQDQRVVTSLDVTAAANSGHSPDAQDRYFDIQQQYQSPTNRATLAKLGGEKEYLTRISNAANYPAAPSEYQKDPQTGNYNTNVSGGSLQDAISKLSPGPGYDYNSSTGQWSAPGTVNPVIRTEAGGPNRASEFNYNRTIPTGSPTGDVPSISNPIPNGIDWPELPKTPGLPEPVKVAQGDAASAINDRNQMINGLLNNDEMPAPPQPSATPTPPPPAKKDDEDYA